MKKPRNRWKFTGADFPKDQWLSLQGLETYYQFNYDAARAYVISLAHRRLRALAKAKGSPLRSLSWTEATSVCDSELLGVLHCYGHIKACREALPYVVYVN